MRRRHACRGDGRQINTGAMHCTRSTQTPRAVSAKVRLGRLVVVRALPLVVALHRRVREPALPLVVDQVGVWVVRSSFVVRSSCKYRTPNNPQHREVCGRASSGDKRQVGNATVRIKSTVGA